MAGETHSASGLVLKLDVGKQTIVVSCDEIPGYMEPMAMTFAVRDPAILEKIDPGARIDFTLSVDAGGFFAEDIRIRESDPADQRPFSAERLRKLQDLTSGKSTKPLAAGEQVADFELINQDRHKIRLSQFRGKVVAISFMYTRCSLPQYCFRLSNNLSQVRRRFADRLGRDLILFTITFDPIHDQPEQLAHYARKWGASSDTWHFLTGSESDVKRICDLFDVDAYVDEGTVMHSLHTAVIGRDGTLVANVQGNNFSAQQLGDLIGTALGAERRARN
jgi:protein SCO1/2